MKTNITFNSGDWPAMGREASHYFAKIFNNTPIEDSE